MRENGGHKWYQVHQPGSLLTFIMTEISLFSKRTLMDNALTPQQHDPKTPVIFRNPAGSFLTLQCLVDTWF